MAKQIKEINQFNKGIILNADEKDIPSDSAAMSFNINPNTEDGVLDGIKTEKFLSSIDGNSSRIIYPFTWGETGYTKNDVVAPILDSGTLCVEDITAFENCKGSVSFTGIKGYVEKLSFQYCHPHMERLISFSSRIGLATTNRYAVIEHESTVSKIATEIAIPDGDGDNTSPGLISLLSVGDYIQFNTTTSFVPNSIGEIIKILSIDVDNNKIFVERGVFSSIKTSYATSTDYYIFINKIMYNAIGNQVSVNSGYFEEVAGWSQIKGNHAKGNAYPYFKTTGLKHITSSNNSIVFDNSAKTMVVNNGSLELKSGDRFTFYATTYSDSNNHASSFKILSIKDDTYHLDTAPTSETITTSASYYFEPTLIKNFTFTHATGSSVGNAEIEKVNDWEQYRRAATAGNYNLIQTDDEADVITQTTTEGLFSETTLFGSDLSTSYYPYRSGDYGLKIGSKYQTASAWDLTESISATDTLLKTTIGGASILLTSFTKGDTMYIGSEYMRIKKVGVDGLQVERGIYGTSAASHSSGDDVYVNHGYEIRQEVDKDWLKPNTDYELSFWAKISTGTSATATIQCQDVAVSNYDEKDITITSAAGTVKTYTFEDTAGTSTGDLDGLKVIVQINGLLSSGTNIAAQLKVAIEHANGHGTGEITVSSSGATRTLTQVYNGFSGNTEITTTGDTGELVITNFTGGQSPDPIFSIMVNGGYFNSSGKWIQFIRSDTDTDSGYTKFITQPTLGQRLRTFYDCTEIRGVSCEEDILIDDIRYRNLSFNFKTPKGDIKDNMIISFGNQGIVDLSYLISNIALLEESILVDTSLLSGISKSSGFIKNKLSRDLVMYDSQNNNLKVISNFHKDNELEVKTIIDSSNNTDMDANSLNEDAVFTPKNREVHIGFGGDKSDSTPKWLGYINHKVFGVKHNDLYLDTDKIGSYDSIGINNLSKICVAGEWEYVEAAITSTGGGTIGDANTILTVGGVIAITHGLTAGDNIVIREYLDINNSWTGAGVWYVSAITDTDTFVCKRNTDYDDYPVADQSMAGNNAYKISYRPFYYYGMKKGDSYIYRITPEQRFNAGTGVGDTDYPKGKIERCSRLDFPVESICCSYGKNGATPDGGHIYALSSFAHKIYRLNVNVAFDAWESTNLSVTEVIQMEYKSFKWSNDHLNGNISGTTAVYDSLADESSPTVEISGLPSDIIETKGPIKTFNWVDSDNNTVSDVTPAHMDTRLWIQAYPGGDEETFTDGDRFLFCGKTEHATGDNIVYFADRTPPTVSRYGMVCRYTTGTKFASGPFQPEFERDLAGSNNSELPAGYAGARALYGIERQEGESWGQHKISQWWHNSEFDFTTGKPQRGESFSWNTNAWQKPFVDWGNNVGWDGNGSKKTAIKVARYGLFQIADNDGDGLLDGTGVVVPNTSNYVADNKKYGDLHRRVSSHAVGLIGSSELNWIRHGGREHGLNDHYFVSGEVPPDNNIDSPVHEDIPNYMDASKIVFVCTDMHFGDLPNSNQHAISAVAQDVDIGGAGAAYYTKVTTGTNHGLQAGDLVYFDGTGSWPGWETSSYVVSVISDTVFYVPVASASVGGSGELLVGGFQKLSSVGGAGYNSAGRTTIGSDTFHFALNTDNKSDGTIFNQHGGFGRLWYTEPMNFGPKTTTTAYTVISEDADGNEVSTVYPNRSNRHWPAIQNYVEQLNFLSGFMIRPFDMDNSGFEKLMISEGLSVDMPCFPDTIYHAGSHVKSGTDIGNQVASKLFLSSPGTENILGEVTDSKLFICEWNFLYPNESSYIPAEATNNDENTDTLNNHQAWEVSFAGTIDSYRATTGTSNAWEYDAALHPVVEIDIDDMSYNSWLSEYDAFYKLQNCLAGMYLTVVDQTTGYTQTRKIIGSIKAGDGPTDNIWLSVHFPFAHTPIALDKFYIWKHSLVATAPVRLIREETLRFAKSSTDSDSMIAYVQDPILAGSMYKQSGVISDLDSSSTTATATTSDFHNLTTDDTVLIEEASDSDYDGTYSITVTGPKTFTFTTSGSGLTNNSTAIWTLPQDSTASTANPISTPLTSPAIKMSFGDLDMRKLKSLVTTDDDAQGSAVAAEIAIHSAAHKLVAGDVVTFNGNTAAHDGTYIIQDKNTDDFDVFNPSTANDTTDAQPITTNQWGGIGASSSSTSTIGEIRAGLSQWDKGDIAGNTLRYDATDDTRFTTTTETSVNIKAASVAGTTDFFRKNIEYKYKVSLIYDGYQEGPLSMSSWGFKDTNSSRQALDIQINVKEFSKRLSAVCLYRKDGIEGFYRLVKQISTDTGWAIADGAYFYNLQDSGTVQASYEIRTGISEITRDLSIKYGLAAELDGFLFVGDCSHSIIDDASNQIFRSKPGKFSIFDWTTDYLILNSKPTALIAHLGKLIAFDNNNLYKINSQTLAIEDIFEGVGCSGKNSVVVTEYGMFFANRQGAYMYNGSTPVKLSLPIQTSGDTDMLSLSASSTSGTSEIKDLSWNNTAGNENNPSPYVTFDSKNNIAMFFVDYFLSEQRETISGSTVLTAFVTTNTRNSYIWAWSISKNRWDLWELSKDEIIGKPFLGKDGEVFVSVGNALYEIQGGSNKKFYTWLSKKLTVGGATQKKVFNKVKISGPKNTLIHDGNAATESDKIIIATDAGRITSGSNSTTANIKYTSDGNDSSDYKLKGSNKTGKWAQFKLEEMEEPVTAVGLIYRLRSVK